MMETEEENVAANNEPANKAVNVFSTIPVTVEVLLGTATMQLAELMSLKPGSDILLDQAIGEPVAVIVNGRKIAKGELYVLETRGDLLGVRILEIISSDGA
jgi:flagellar motor switch protein FliN